MEQKTRFAVIPKIRKRKNGNFSKGVLYYMDSLMEKYFQLGKEHLYATYTLLKKEYASGAFHCCLKPQWFTKSQQTYYRYLCEMEELGMIHKQHGTFNLTSLMKLSGVKKHYKFYPNSHIMPLKSIDELIRHWQDETVKRNYRKQLRNVVLDELGYSNNDLIVSKSKRKEFKKLYSSYLDSKRALKFTAFSKKNKTALSIIGCGNLFNRSGWYGKQVMDRLIEEGKIKRKLYPVRVFVPYTSLTLPTIVKKCYAMGMYFKNGSFYRTITCFAWIRDIEAKELMRVAANLRKLRLIQS